ncbi:MAG: multidrug effflux MFS transporter [Anaerolineae bacterium]|nr:multidrug effflux MFS transporter [Anaerolineae bacterium]
MSIKQKVEPSLVEFVIILSLMMSLTALSIDAMLPALPQIGSDLQVQSANDRQLVVSLIFLGMAVGQLFFGPLSDKTGRKPAIYAGLILYIFGSLISVLSFSFPMLLVGRLLQGAGVSAPRAVGLALVRDRYEGRAMARVMSFVMTIFILVPMIAPMMGQAILLFSGWRTIFGSFILLAIITLIWFALRMPETLPLENRAPFSLRRIVKMAVDIIKIRPALGYTVIAGFVSGAHLGYLNSAQQVFQEQYNLGKLFPIFFALVALSIGFASFLNARLVMRFGMRTLVWWSLWVILGLSTVMFVVALLVDGQPPLAYLMVYLMLTFFCVGILFGNNNALAMQPLGSVAGIGAAVVGSLSTFISVPLGIVIGQSYDGTILPLVIGMAVVAGFSLVVARWAEGGTFRL